MAARRMNLTLTNVSAGYGPTPVLRNVSLAQGEGEILGIVGHNGMGKTTLLRVLSGLIAVERGSIVFDGEPIEAMPAHRRSRAGIAYVRQGGRGFPGLTVAESLALAALAESRCGTKSVDEILALFPRLKALLGRQSAALSGGERQLLAIACAVIRSPRLLLLDELSEGVQPSIVEEIAERLRMLHDQERTSILIVDQELPFVASLAARAHIMHKGQLIREVTPRDLADPEILGGFSSAH